MYVHFFERFGSIADAAFLNFFTASIEFINSLETPLLPHFYLNITFGVQIACNLTSSFLFKRQVFRLIVNGLKNNRSFNEINNSSYKALQAG